MDNLMSEVEQRANLAFSNQMEMLTFYLSDNQLYGLNVFKIIEIQETPKNVTKVPCTASCIKGSMDFRGHAINLIDLSEAMGLPPIDYENCISYVLICEYSTSTNGFMVKQPDRLLNKNWEEIISPAGNIFDSSYLTAIAYEGETTIQILDVEKLLSEIIGIDDAISDVLVEQSKQLSAKYSIMAVDDSKAARTLLKSALTQLGIAHTIYDNPANALKALEESVAGDGQCEYDLIFSDIEMPVMDGFTFTRKVKANPKLAHIHLTLHSSLSNKSNEHKARQMGADDFIPKFQPDRIAKAILDQLEKVR